MTRGGPRLGTERCPMATPWRRSMRCRPMTAASRDLTHRKIPMRAWILTRTGIPMHREIPTRRPGIPIRRNLTTPGIPIRTRCRDSPRTLMPSRIPTAARHRARALARTPRPVAMVRRGWQARVTGCGRTTRTWPVTRTAWQSGTAPWRSSRAALPPTLAPADSYGQRGAQGETDPYGQTDPLGGRDAYGAADPGGHAAGGRAFPGDSRDPYRGGSVPGRGGDPYGPADRYGPAEPYGLAEGQYQQPPDFGPRPPGASSHPGRGAAAPDPATDRDT